MGLESKEALAEWERPVWHSSNWVVGRTYRTLEQVVSQAGPGGRFPWETPERKRASLPDPERMVQSAPAFGVSPSESVLWTWSPITR